MHNNGGFTLIELILVTVIIGILAGMVVVNYGGYVGDAQQRAALGDIALYGSAIDLYLLEHNDQYPPSLDGLITPERNYVKEVRPDPWGNPYVYQPGTNAKKADYVLYSAGPDGEPGTEDDVYSGKQI